MGRRAMMRENIRLGVHTNRPTEFILSRDRLEDIRKETEKTIQETQKKTIKSMILVFVMALNNELDFGTKRINRVIERASLQFQCLESGELLESDLENWCEENNIKF